MQREKPGHQHIEVIKVQDDIVLEEDGNAEK